MPHANLYPNLKREDPKMWGLVYAAELQRRKTLSMIASESDPSAAVREPLASLLGGIYAEGYPRRRYYPVDPIYDKMEDLVQERACQIMGVPHANVQPYSGSPANLAVYMAVCEREGRVLGFALPSGGHLTHGYEKNATGILWQTAQYGHTAGGYIDLDEVERLAADFKPTMIIVGCTAYPRRFPFKEIGEIGDRHGCIVLADVAHIFGLIVAGAHPSPVPHVHVITTTTHKSGRGPRAGLIFVTEKGLRKDPDLATKIDTAVFPRLQGGPHMNVIASIGVMLNEAARPEFKTYGHQVVSHARTFGEVLTSRGIELSTGGTDTHLVLAKCGHRRGYIIEVALESVGILANRNRIPGDSSAIFPDGFRAGLVSATSRGMKEPDVRTLGNIVGDVFDIVADESLPTQGGRAYIDDLRQRLRRDARLDPARQAVREICETFKVRESYMA